MILPSERQQAIRDRLVHDGRVIAADLAIEFATSEDTIRRDLRDLASAGLCQRVYGGALKVSPVSGTLAERSRVPSDAKTTLGRAAAALVRAGQLVFIDAGSTNLCIAQALAGTLNITVATNAPAIVAALDPKPAVDVLLIGGRFDRRSGGTLGVRTLREVQHLRPDLYFIGACAADAVAGLAVFDPEEADLKRGIAAVSGALAAAVTDEKLATAAPYRVSAWVGMDHLVLSGQAALERCGPMPEGGPTIHFAS